MSDLYIDTDEAECPNCEGDGDLFQRGPFVGCRECTGMWAPEAIVKANEFMDGTSGDSL